MYRDNHHRNTRPENSRRPQPYSKAPQRPARSSSPLRMPPPIPSADSNPVPDGPFTNKWSVRAERAKNAIHIATMWQTETVERMKNPIHSNRYFPFLRNVPSSEVLLKNMVDCVQKHFEQIQEWNQAIVDDIENPNNSSVDNSTPAVQNINATDIAEIVAAALRQSTTSLKEEIMNEVRNLKKEEKN